ncbi:nucleotidyltransferase family protein [Defluviimonas sp. WL0024]|uniref:Nucleotidyltransferase family protein n=1 Tax=Albidovulum salinarum TaxID=2984153 RepID=A0ABT2X365_9RHOB|nr:nucleotidyltransferase family protein [Defluviimonas sp. WL0024]MCU9848060.1 nucleotidyltransferase family protein [Defluviimonas sp. WL0024]
MRQLPDALMLFTAGLGTRMRALTTTRPKPLIEVAGRALVDHALAQADGAGIGRIVANLHYLPGQIRAHLAHRPDLRFSDETETILETGGGLRHALPLLGPGAVFTLNTDAVWTGPNALARLRAGWDPGQMDGLLLVVSRERATGHTGPGDFGLDAEGRLSRGQGFVYTGAQILKPDGLAEIPDQVFSLNRLWDRMLAEGRLYGAVHDGGWCDVGRPEAIPLAEALLNEVARDV